MKKKLFISILTVGAVLLSACGTVNVNVNVFLDGHSHDTEQVVMKNKDGKDVVRSAVGTKMSCIGYSHITDEGYYYGYAV